MDGGRWWKRKRKKRVDGTEEAEKDEEDTEVMAVVATEEREGEVFTKSQAERPLSSTRPTAADAGRNGVARRTGTAAAAAAVGGRGGCGG